MVRRRAARLDDENIGTADVFIDFYFGLAIREGGDVDVSKGLAEAIGDTFGKGSVSGSTDDFHEKNEQ